MCSAVPCGGRRSDEPRERGVKSNATTAGAARAAAMDACALARAVAAAGVVVVVGTNEDRPPALDR
jgi:hypothetical protein